MPFTIFDVVPDSAVYAPGDIVLRTFANRSQVSNNIRLLIDENIILAPAFANHSTIGVHRLTFGDEFDIVLDEAFENVSEFGGDTELTEAPPDEVILLDTAFENASTFGGDTELTEAPPDEIIRLTAVINTSSFGAETFLAPIFDEDDYDAIAEGGSSESVPG